ncbi:MAG TPA: PAS domain S-box protein, partial [Armatimonadetes bacterium]|nr:PAS domain S-box protein [Armatimonadota bacterium]
MFNLVHSLRTERERLITEILSHIEERGERAPGENPEYLVRSLVNALIVALVQGKPGHFVTFVRNCARREARLGRGRRLLVVWYALEALEDWLWALSLDDDTALAGMMRWERVKSYLDGGKTALVRTYLEVMEQESQRLMNALETYVHLTENVPAIVYSMDEQGRFTSISHTAIRLLGYSQEELLGQHYSKLMDPEEAERFGRMLSERRTGERATKRLRVRLRDRAGNLREFEVSATGVYDDEGRFLGTDGIAREPIGPQALFSYTLDAEGHFTALSEGVTELLGYTPEELVGQHFSVLMDETEFVLMGRFFGERRQGGRASRRVKITLRDRKGEPHEFEITARGRYDEEGTFLGTEGTARDLTEQSRLEREIVEERSKFQAVFEAAGVGLSLIGADYRVQEANQYQRSLTNGSDLEGQLCYAVYFGRETPCPWCGLTEALMTGQTIVRHSVHHPESERVYNLSFAPVRDALGESVGVIEALIDVTPLHDLAQRFARSEKLRLLGQLAGGLAHELSNVLATVSGRAQLLLRHVEEEEVQRTLRLITEAATTAAQQL